MSARSKSPQMVFLGAALALIASSLLAVAAGDTLLRMVPLRVIRMATGVAFVLIGSVLFVKSVGMK